AASGRVDDLLGQAESLIESVDRSGSVPTAISLRSAYMQSLAAQGKPSTSGKDAEVLVAQARATGIPEVISEGVAGAAEAFAAAGNLDRARSVLFELAELQEAHATPDYVTVLAKIVRLALAAGDAALARRFVDGVQPVTPLADHALTSSHAQL